MFHGFNHLIVLNQGDRQGLEGVCPELGSGDQEVDKT